MGSQPRNSDQIRATGKALAERLRTEPGFRGQLDADPSAALTGAGLPADGVEDFLREWSATAEVGGYFGVQPCDNTCSWTCIITG